MNISSVDRKTITRQDVIAGVLITAFRASIFQGHEMHPAGTLANRSWTDKDSEDYRKLWPLTDAGDGILSITVTRFGKLFHDAGEFFPA